MLGVMMKPCPKDRGKTVGPVEPNGRLISMAYWLVVEPTHLKNMLVKLEMFPQFSG